MSTSNPTPVLVMTEDGLERAVSELEHAPRLALDIESNGLFKYRAGLCTLQLANVGAGTIYVVDTIALGPLALRPLARILGESGPRKIVHDVAFDARILGESDLPLSNVLDTSIAARMLGRTATGLASLLESELGLLLDKKLQHHDWTVRPLRPHELQYLGDDVRYLGPLADVIGQNLEEKGIAPEVEEETRYRLAQAAAAAKEVDRRPPYLRLKGIDKVPALELPILRHLANVRERAAMDLDVPPYKVLGPDVLFAIAKARPQTPSELQKVRGATNGHRARSLAEAMLDAVTCGIEDGGIPDDERALLQRPRLPSAVAKARRGREARLTAWRKAEAKRRGVDEQVVLPGHCLQDLADIEQAAGLDDLARVPGIGRFRVDRDGAALLLALGAPSDA